MIEYSSVMHPVIVPLSQPQCTELSLFGIFRLQYFAYVHIFISLCNQCSVNILLWTMRKWIFSVVTDCQQCFPLPLDACWLVDRKIMGYLLGWVNLLRGQSSELFIHEVTSQTNEQGWILSLSEVILSSVSPCGLSLSLLFLCNFLSTCMEACLRLLTKACRLCILKLL